MKPTCPYCSNDDESMLEEIGFTAGLKGLNLYPSIPLQPGEELHMKRSTYLCVSCSKEFTVECN